MKTIVSLSGGMDSATVLAKMRNDNHTVLTVGFYYGSKHNIYELEAAEKLARYYGKPFQIINLGEAFLGFRSDLLLSGNKIPEGHYEEESMSATVVPARNMIFISILAGLAASLGIEFVVIGVHGGDHAIYPDCRPEFIDPMAAAVLAATDHRVALMTPFLDFSKKGILKWGLKHNVPYELTRTCYKDQPMACGKCGSCVERLSSFHINGKQDPINYVDREYYKIHL